MSADLTWKELEHRFRELQAEMRADRVEAWYTRFCWDDGATKERWDYHGGDERSRKRFQSLASAGARKLGFTENANADNGWLARVREYLGAKITSTGTQTEYGRTATTEGVRIDRVAEASADYCLQLIARGTPESTVGPQSQLRNSDTPGYSAVHDLLEPRMYESLEPGDANVPASLGRAVRRLSDRFGSAHFQHGFCTQQLCYSKLRNEVDWQEAANQMAVEALQKKVGTQATERFEGLLNEGTPPALFRGFFDLYVEGVKGSICEIFDELVEIGLNNPQSIDNPPEWAAVQARHFVRFYSRRIEEWVKAVCGKAPNEESNADGGNSGMEWRAPRLMTIRVSDYQPSDAGTMWERQDAQITSSSLNALLEQYVYDLESQFYRLKGDAAVRCAQRPKYPSMFTPAPSRLDHSNSHQPEPLQTVAQGKSQRSAGRKRRKRKIGPLELRKCSIIFGVLQNRSKGREYCAALDERKLGIPPAWLSEGCPDTYSKAYRMPGAPWRKRIRDEKHRYQTKLKTLSPNEVDRIIRGIC